MQQVTQTSRQAGETLAFDELAAEISAGLSNNADCMLELGGQNVKTLEAAQRVAEDATAPLKIQFQLGSKKIAEGFKIENNLEVSSATIRLLDVADFPGLRSKKDASGNEEVLAWQGLITIKARRLKDGTPPHPINLPIIVAAKPNVASTPILACFSNAPSNELGTAKLAPDPKAKDRPLVLETKTFKVFARSGSIAAAICPKGSALTHVAGFQTATEEGPGEDFYPSQPRCVNLNMENCDPDHPFWYKANKGTAVAKIAEAKLPKGQTNLRGCIVDGGDSEIGCSIDCLVMTTATTVN